MNKSTREKHSNLIKHKALSMGFDFCGISKADNLHEEEANLESWLGEGFHGKMAYLANHFEKRLDPTKLVPGAKSVISLLYNYCPPEKDENSLFRIAKYAWGEDYHFVIKGKLKTFLNELNEEIGEIDGRVFVDSAPVMERQWAAKSGLGWIGKNGLLINKNRGSYFFLAELIIDLDLDADGPIKNYCGTCTKCLDACPTDAFVDAGVLDASRCISYLTIELKEEIPDEFQGKNKEWVFGCDICQDVCPWNRFSNPHQEAAFKKMEGIDSIQRGNWKDFTEDVFNRVFKKSPLKRTKYAGLKRNVDFITEKPCKKQGL